MPSPFPGMDPYLETRRDLPNVHAQLIVQLQRELRKVLPPRFVAKVESALIVESPDTAVLTTVYEPDTSRSETEDTDTHRPGPMKLFRRLIEPEMVLRDDADQRYVRIYDQRNGGHKTITVIQLLSPTNKDGHAGSEQYRRKQDEIRESGIHLLEIDLLRYGKHVSYVPKATVDKSGPYDYLITLADASRPLYYLFWRISLHDSLPALALPLTSDVSPVPLDLQAVLDRCYDEEGLGASTNYTTALPAPFSLADSLWADELLRTAGVR